MSVTRSELRARLDSPYRVGRKLGGWDEVQILRDQVELMHEDWDEETQGPWDEEQAWQWISEDGLFWETEWEWVSEWITELLKERMPKETWPSVPWLVEVQGFGWRNLNGYKLVDTLDGEEFLREILPNTQCTFYFYEYGVDGLALNNFHHDSPTGEWYYITPLWGSVCCHCGREYTSDEEWDERNFILEWDECPVCMAEKLEWDLYREDHVFTPYLYSLAMALDRYNKDPDHRFRGSGWLDRYLTDMCLDEFAPEIAPFAPYGEIDCRIDGSC